MKPQPCESNLYCEYMPAKGAFFVEWSFPEINLHDRAVVPAFEYQSYVSKFLSNPALQQYAGTEAICELSQMFDEIWQDYQDWICSN